MVAAIFWRCGVIDILPVTSAWIERIVNGADTPKLGEVELSDPPVDLTGKRQGQTGATRGGAGGA
jgi:hypothetical protein